jgi:hypothetical protein
LISNILKMSKIYSFIAKEIESKKQLSLEETSKPELSYFELQAYWGATKHMGGLKGYKRTN